MTYPADRKYTKDHEWVRISGDTGEVGITDYAQQQLGDVVYVELPDVGRKVTAGESFGSIESVKAVSELFAPMTGEVVEINDHVKNHPEMHLIILLVDERPEEVTDFRRSCPQAEIMASSNDSDIKSHTRIAQLAVERAKRLVEAGKDVFILLDSITRTARAFNNAMGGGGRTMSGGIDARAMETPRKLFSAARNTEEAGSLTIVATALIETGSRMDELIFQEFKGTGNMEMVLDRKISDQRIYPAVDIFLSGTRREELLLQPWELEKINLIRRGLAGHKPGEAIERLLTFVKKFPTNEQMLKGIPG